MSAGSSIRSGHSPTVVTEQLRRLAEESQGIVVVTDASGLVLHRVGDEWLKERAAEMNLVEGARYDEAADGTNGIGTALAADRALQVFAFEHFNERHHQWICSCAPVHDPVSGRVVALVDLSSLWKIAHPRSLELVTTAARTIEQCLVDARRDRDARLRRRYSDLMTRSTDLLVDGDGYVLEGAELAHQSPFDVPEGGGEVVLGDGSVAVAVPLGRGEAYLLRQGTTRRGMSAPAAKGLARVEERARELATEQAALRQVATLVARESSPDQLFAIVAEQVAQVFDVPHVGLVRYEPDGSVVVGGYSDGGREPFAVGSRWPLNSPGVVATVRHTGRPARLEDYADVPGEIAAVVRDAGMRSAVATPIVVERRLWGAMVVLSPRHEPFPEGTEARLTDFTELIATAIANAEAREALARLADEQAALRRVATLVAQEVPQADVFGAIAEEIGRLLGTEEVRMLRFDSDGSAVVVGSLGRPDAFPLGSHLQLDGDSVAARVLRTRRPARLDDYGATAGLLAETARSIGVRAVVGVPVLVEGRLWGAISAGSTHDGPLPPDTEARLDQFTKLMATAIANAEARTEVHRLADEQAALRRVAVLVAQQPSPSEVFTAVTEAVGLLLDADLAVLHVFPGDGTAATVASWGADGPMLPIGTRFPLNGDNLAARIFDSGAPARMYSSDEAWERAATVLSQSLRVRSAVGAPILVEGKLWGALMAATRGVEPWAENAENRIAAFTELVATAIANAESREARAVLAEEQAALRRVATLVAQGTSPQDLFAAVAEEVGRLLPVGSATMGRFEADGSVTTVASWSAAEAAFPTGRRWPTEGTNVAWMVLQTGRAARIDDFSAATDPIGVAAREAGIESAVGSPIVVEGHLWGVMTATSTEGPLPPDTEARLASFTELVATAIANAESSAELAASRRRIVAASDDARRRIERDLHDGAQQRLVSLGLKLGAMRADPPTGDALKEQLAGVTEDVGSVLDALVEIARGIHPAILSAGRAGSGSQGPGAPLGSAGRASCADRRPASRRGRGSCLLRRRGGAHEYGQTRACLCRAHGCDDRRRDPDADGSRRRRRRGRSGQRLRPRRFARPSRGARRHDHDRQLRRKWNVRRRHTPDGDRARPGTRELPRSATRARVAHESGLRSEPRPAAQHRAST